MLRRWNCFWFAPEPAFNLGVCRALAYLVVIACFFSTPFAQWAELGPKSAFWEPLWFFKSLHVPVLGASVLGVLGLIWKCALVMACLGLFTTYTAVITFLLGAYLIGLTFNYGKIEHQTMPMILVMGILAVSRCGAGFSLDNWFAKRRGFSDALPSGEYRWPVRLVWLLMSITFFAAGVAKLRATGIRWAIGPGFSTLLIQQYYSSNPPHTQLGLIIANHPWLSHLMATGSLATELLFPLALFDRRARRILPLAAFGMQIGIGLLMNIWFTQFLAMYVFWIRWDRTAPPPAQNDARVEPRKRSATSAIAAFCCLSAAVGALASAHLLRYGVHLFPDSWSYWAGSVNLLYGRGYYKFTGQRILFWPPLYAIYLEIWQYFAGVTGQTLARSNVALVFVAAFGWTAAALVPFRDALDRSLRLRRLSMVFPLLASLFIALTIAGRFRGVMGHNLVYMLYPWVLLVTHFMLRPSRSLKSLVQLAALAVALLTMLVLTHGVMLFMAASTGLAVFLFLPAQPPRIRLAIGGILSLLPWAIWAVVMIRLGAIASHPSGTKPRFGWGEYAHQTAVGIAELFGPKRHGVGYLLFAVICAITAFMLAKRLRRGQDAGGRTPLAYLLICGGLLLCQYVAFNRTYIIEPLYADRYLLFVPLTLLPLLAMLVWCELELPDADPPEAPRMSSVIVRRTVPCAALLAIAAATIFAGKMYAYHVRESVKAAGPLSIDRAGRDTAFAYNRLTIRPDYAKGPPFVSGSLIVVAPQRRFDISAR